MNLQETDMKRPKIKLPPMLKMWNGDTLVSVQRVGVEYRLLEPSKQRPTGQLFIGYESTSNKQTRVHVVRWVPGVYQEGL